MEQYVKRTQRDYSMSFKLSIVRQIERGEMTYIIAEIDIQSFYKRITSWMIF